MVGKKSARCRGPDRLAVEFLRGSDEVAGIVGVGH